MDEKVLSVTIILVLALIPVLVVLLKKDKAELKAMEDLDDKLKHIMWELDYLSSKLNSVEHFLTFEDTEFYKELKTKMGR